LCLTHAKACKHGRCLVPFCALLKVKLEQQRLEQLRKDEVLMRRRMAQMMLRSVTASQKKARETAATTTNPHEDLSPSQQCEGGVSERASPGGGGKTINVAERSLPETETSVQEPGPAVGERPKIASGPTGWEMTINGMLQGQSGAVPVQAGGVPLQAGGGEQSDRLMGNAMMSIKMRGHVGTPEISVHLEDHADQQMMVDPVGPQTCRAGTNGSQQVQDQLGGQPECSMTLQEKRMYSDRLLSVVRQSGGPNNSSTDRLMYQQQLTPKGVAGGGTGDPDNRVTGARVQSNEGSAGQRDMQRLMGALHGSGVKGPGGQETSMEAVRMLKTNPRLLSDLINIQVNTSNYLYFD